MAAAKPVTEIDRVFGEHNARNEVEERKNTRSIDTGAAFGKMNRLTLARINVDRPEIATFEAINAWTDRDLSQERLRVGAETPLRLCTLASH